MRSKALLNVLFLVVVAYSCNCELDVNSHTEGEKNVSAGLSRTCSQTVSRYSGIQLIHPQPGFGDPFEVFCDQDYDGGGWIVIQNRFDGSVRFNRGWKDYENGFGDINGEHWLGLKKIHELTYSLRYELNVLLELQNGTEVAAKYSDFSIAGPTVLYQLKSLGTYSGDAGESLNYHHDMKFSTFDNDNDFSFGNCAAENGGAWWYNNCRASDLNGRYNYYYEVYWSPHYNMRKTRMMIRVVDQNNKV